MPPAPAIPPVSAGAARAPTAPEADDDSSRRLDDLREEYAAYEREAARLRSLLRRALGLDPPLPAEEAPPAAEGAGPSDGPR